ncbi:Tetratricopeptide repeat protein 7B, partial [Galemys pyrenaicus]
MLQIWKSCYSLTNPSDSGRGSSLLDRTIADRRQLNTITLPDFGDPETVSDSSSSSSSLSRTESPLHLFVSSHLHSHPKPDTFVWPPAAHSFSDPGPRQEPSLCSVHATSVAASRVEQALSEVASSLQSSAPKQGPLHPWMTLAQIWLHAAEVYIGIGKPAEASACTQEAANLFPMSHNVLYMRGQVAELRGNLDEARRWYEEALSISPTHVKSMQRLVSLASWAGPWGPEVLFRSTRWLGTLHPSSATKANAAVAAPAAEPAGTVRALCRWPGVLSLAPPGLLPVRGAESGPPAALWAWCLGLYAAHSSLAGPGDLQKAEPFRIEGLLTLGRPQLLSRGLQAVRAHGALRGGVGCPARGVTPVPAHPAGALSWVQDQTWGSPSAAQPPSPWLLPPHHQRVWGRAGSVCTHCLCRWERPLWRAGWCSWQGLSGPLGSRASAHSGQPSWPGLSSRAARAGHSPRSLACLGAPERKGQWESSPGKVSCVTFRAFAHARAPGTAAASLSEGSRRAHPRERREGPVPGLQAQDRASSLGDPRGLWVLSQNPGLRKPLKHVSVHPGGSETGRTEEGRDQQ